METQIKNTKPVKLHESSIFRVVFLFWGVRFRKCVLPDGLAEEPPKIMKIPKCLDLIGYSMVSTNFICKFDVKNTTDAFKHVPDPV